MMKYSYIQRLLVLHGEISSEYGISKSRDWGSTYLCRTFVVKVLKRRAPSAIRVTLSTKRFKGSSRGVFKVLHESYGFGYVRAFSKESQIIYGALRTDLESLDIGETGDRVFYWKIEGISLKTYKNAID